MIDGRLSKFYTPIPAQHRLTQVQRIFELVRERSDALCNFVEMPMTDASHTQADARDDAGALETYDSPSDEVLRVIYRHYATLYFVFCVDEAESELGILDLIQVFVEALDRCFENVCELDLIFNFERVHALLSCMIVGGYVQETSIDSISSLFAQLKKSQTESAQSGTIAGSLPEINLSSATGSWSEKLTRGLGRGRFGR